MNKVDQIREHYETQWRSQGKVCSFRKGPFCELGRDFVVLRFCPSIDRNMWTYATCGMSLFKGRSKIELHIFSPFESGDLVEILYSCTYFHKGSSNLDLWHTVNFGQPWIAGSRCSYGLISLPYLDGPKLENILIGESVVKCYWLLPVTKREVEFKEKKGIEALEQKFEESGLNYIDIYRESVVP